MATSMTGMASSNGRGPPSAAAHPASGADARALERLRWRCRRGMLENDLILTRFLDTRGATMRADEMAALERLLELDDNELWDLASGRADPVDAALRPLVAALRAA
jgi:antitoxin CptB